MQQAGQPPIKPDEIVDILLRRRWLLVLPLCLTLTVGLYLVLTLPRTYAAATTILVQGQRVPGEYVKSIVTTDIDERINTISQQILSRSNLEKIIEQFDLYTGEEGSGMFLEDKIKSLRGRIKVDLTRDRRGTDAFTIRYKGTKPERVMAITNTLASLYMDENLKLREAQAVGTSEFLDSELEKTRQKLVEKEETLSAYRSKYMGGLPDELESNLRTLDRLQQQLSDRQAMLRETRNSIGALKAQMAQMRELRSRVSDSVAQQPSGDGESPAPGEGSTLTRLFRAERVLEDLQLKYTEKHPDVVKQKATVAKLRRLLEDEETVSAAEDGGTAVGPKPKREYLDPAVAAMREADIQQEIQLGQLQSDVGQIQQDIRDIQRRMKVYQRRVDETPQREQELRSLERDYGNIQEIYSSLLDRKLEAELSVNMEKKQKGEQFRILDHASLPQRPISPDIRKLFVMSVGAGAAAAGGLIFLLEMLDGAIRRDEDIEAVAGLHILASVPPIKKTRDRIRDRIRMVGFLAASGYALAVFAAFGFVYVKGVDKLLSYL